MSLIQQDFRIILQQLDLSANEVAGLLSVTPRTIHRWIENPHEISGPAEQALRAWLRLKHYNLPWRPDGFPLGEDNPKLPEQIAMQRNEILLLDQIIYKVKARGGTRLPWQIDLQRKIARLETIEVTFYSCWNNSFSPATYRRLDDKVPDMVRDQDILEEAIFAIHEALSKFN